MASQLHDVFQSTANLSFVKCFVKKKRFHEFRSLKFYFVPCLALRYNW